MDQDMSKIGEFNKRIGHYRGYEYLLEKAGGPQNYLEVSSALEELADYAKQNPNEWINYCTYINDPASKKDDGLIFLVSKISELLK